MTTAALALLRRMWAHRDWADEQLWPALATEREADAEAWREYSHVIGAEETWLSRLEGRASRLAVWPDVSRPTLSGVRDEVSAGYRRYLESLDPAALDSVVHYTNTAGRSFTTAVVDILTHVALHGQYHRGKINLILRRAGVDPVPVDFITYARGAPAAITPR